MQSWHSRNLQEFHINNYRLQYWLYAILNKKFGKEVKFHRDSLHHMYEVNRHGFEVATNTLALSEVKEYLLTYLKSCGYQLDKKHSFSDNYITFNKSTKREKCTEDLYINIDVQPRGSDYKNSAKAVLSITPRAYWNKNKE